VRAGVVVRRSDTLPEHRWPAADHILASAANSLPLRAAVVEAVRNRKKGPEQEPALAGLQERLLAPNSVVRNRRDRLRASYHQSIDGSERR